ncbi:TPA: hypothetical protein LU109_003602 [Enterobacter hormaechei subsp. xiangfangensis]|nr:hypothetical protein [Enterobacter hormaechei subsp. xiangfangensis]
MNMTELDLAKQARGWVLKEMCTGCGTIKTLEEIAIEAPQALSCCPERKMVETLIPADYIERRVIKNV